MELLDNQKQNKFQTFSCGNTKVMFDNNGYIVKATGFTFVMWSTLNQDEKLIGLHITELAKLLKNYALNRETYISFLENVFLKFYETKAKDNTNELEIEEEKRKQLVRTT